METDLAPGGSALFSPVIVCPRVPWRLRSELSGPPIALRGIPRCEQRVDAVVLEAEKDAVVTPDVGVPAVIAVLGRGLAASAGGHLDWVQCSDVFAEAAQQ